MRRIASLLTWPFRAIVGLFKTRSPEATPIPDPDRPSRLLKPKSPIMGMWGFNEPFGQDLRDRMIDLYPATGVMSYRGAVGDSAKERDPVAEGLHAYQWLSRVEEASLSRPNDLATLVFRPMWNLVNGRGWSVGDVVEMARTFLDGIANGFAWNRHVLGALLRDDFARHPYDSRWDEIVTEVHGIARGRDIDLPFYFSNHMSHPVTSGGIYDHGARLSDRYSGLVKWLRVFEQIGAQAVFLPQFFPQAQNDSSVTSRWGDCFEALDALQRHQELPPFQVQPVIQASAYLQSRGTTSEELLRQLEATIGYKGKLDIAGAWLMSWSTMDSSFTWGADSQWRKGKGYANVVNDFLARSDAS